MNTVNIQLDKALFDKASQVAGTHNRTTAKQIAHWATIGYIMEDNPDLSYEFVRWLLIAQTEVAAGKVEPYEFG